jgi:hypothetical protein
MSATNFVTIRVHKDILTLAKLAAAEQGAEIGSPIPVAAWVGGAITDQAKAQAKARERKAGRPKKEG